MGLLHRECGARSVFTYTQSDISLILMSTKHDSMPLNPFPHDKILEQTKLKAFADDKLNLTEMIISVFDRVENIVGKG